MSFIQSVRQKIEQVSQDVRERARTKEIEKQAERAFQKETERLVAEKRREEQRKQAIRFAGERVKSQTDIQIKQLKKGGDSRQRGFEMLGFGAMRQPRQPIFNPITGGFGRVEQAQRPQRLSKKQRRKMKREQRQQFREPQRFDVVGGGFSGSGGRDIVGMGLRRGGI